MLINLFKGSKLTKSRRTTISRLLHGFIVKILSLHKQGSLTSEVTFRTLDGMKAAAKYRDGWRKLQKRNERTEVQKVICPELFILCTQRLKKSIKTKKKSLKSGTVAIFS